MASPPDAVLAESALALAVPSPAPASPGHTLIVARRAISSWFDATAAERAELLALVGDVKLLLDARHRPDGYTVGFDEGLAAGPRLELHVIPRYRSERAPRGLASLCAPGGATLATGGLEDPFIQHLRPLFDAAEDVAIVAAFVQESGLARIRASIDGALRRGARVRVLTGDYLDITQAGALEELAAWTVGDDEEDAGAIEARVVETERLPPPTRSFHPKSWRFEGPSLAALYVGSSNLSRAALETGVEWNLRVDRAREPEAYRRAVEEFEAWWRRGRVPDAAWIAAYAARAREVALPRGEVEADDIAPPPAPTALQEEALAKLAATRRSGQRRGLVVLATGLGKTWLAAFDVARFEQEIGRSPRILFVAHRREILLQAAFTFRRMLRPRRHGASFGFYAGQSEERGAEHLFASVQKLTRNLAAFARDRFDYLVIDEVHHAAAPSYRRVLDHFAPSFALGLTATPERGDEADLLGLFDDNLVHRVDLGIGIGLGMLVPFEYFGLADGVDYQTIPWRNRRFDPAALSAAVEDEPRMERLLEAWRAHPGQRTLIFCASVSHANFTRAWLRARGLRVEAIHSGPGADDRELALARLVRGELDAVCSVDVLNEGVDLPSVDRVIMLRPTESPVVFLQQLGRGLRRSPETSKARLTVIDFIGNHRMFEERLRQVLGLAGGELAAVVAARAPLVLPNGCAIDIELAAIDLLPRLARRVENDAVAAYRQLRDGRGDRPTAGELQRLGFPPSAITRATGRSWFEFVEDEGDLEDPATRAELSGLLEELERGRPRTARELATLEALLEAGALFDGLALDELAARADRMLPAALREAGPTVGVAGGAWAQLRWFQLHEGRLRCRAPVSSRDAAAAMVRELVDYRLARLRARRAAEPGLAFDCKLLTHQRDPILKLPRGPRSDLPSGETDVRLPDGAVWSFRFAKEYVNVARPAGTAKNALPELLRRWFGERAGQPGTQHAVRFTPGPDGLHVAPLAAVLSLRARVRAYPSLRAAAGAALGEHEHLEAEEVALPTTFAGDDYFAVRATGSSMDGGKSPIRDGDWVILRKTVDNLAAAEGEVALVDQPGDTEGRRYQLKRVVREGRLYLRSDRHGAPSFEVTEHTRLVGVRVESIGPERIGPPAGTTIAEDALADRFALAVEPRNGRHDGHLFLFVESGDDFDAPDRVRGGHSPRPGETAFVLARADGGWRYLGVGRQEDGRWAVPALDYATASSLGVRGVSRTLPADAVARAETIVRRVLDAGPEVAGLQILGPAPKGGLIVRTQDGAGERTISIADLGWAMLAMDDARLEGGLADEARVNRSRYIEGTPKGSTRWIDTKHALALLRAAGVAAGTR